MKARKKMTDEKMTIELALLITQTVSAVALPIIVAGFGWYISRKLEKMRQSGDRETLWREYQAGEFLEQVKLFQAASDDIIFHLGVWGLMSREDTEPSVEDQRNLIENLNKGIKKLAFMERKLTLLAHTNGNSGDTISINAQNFQTAVSDSIKSNYADFDRIFDLYAELMEATNTAYKELLGA